jgi:ATP/maltotriose-dependent transcriptional regulator MalT
MHTTLLTTKFHTPRPTPNLVARPRLTQRLDQGLQSHCLILVITSARSQTRRPDTAC